MLLQPITVQFSKSTLKPSVYTLIACVTLVDIKHLIYDNEVLIGMDSSAAI